MRNDFSQQTLDTLAKRVGMRCSNPGCRKLTTGPRTDPSRILNIGVGAHITAASPGGPRFDLSLSPEERRSPENGIWLCQNCAKLIDNDSVRYTTESIRCWKQEAEAAVLAEIESLNSQRLSPLENSVDIEIDYQEVRITSQRHDYRLLVILHNLGNNRLSTYHVDLEMPARVIDRPQGNALYIPDRSNGKTCFYRVAYNNQGDIYPGDTKVVVAVAYYIDNELYINRGNLLAQPVRVTLYHPDYRPLSVEKPFREFQAFG